MQDRYVGDVGDFAKFGLARALLGGSGRRPGLAWYYVPPSEEAHKVLGDGRHVDYLDRDEFCRCDPHLASAMRRLVSSGDRRVSAFDLPALLGSDTVQHADPLPGRDCRPGERPARRAAWFRAMECALRDCDGVFLDPDNGIAGPRVGPRQAVACKFAFPDEIAALARDRVGIVYHHLCRQGTHLEQVRRWADRLARHTARAPGLVAPLRWRAYSGRAFFVLSTPGTVRQVERDLAAFLGTGWGRFFERVAWHPG